MSDQKRERVTTHQVFTAETLINSLEIEVEDSLDRSVQVAYVAEQLQKINYKGVSAVRLQNIQRKTGVILLKYGIFKKEELT